LPTWQDEIAGWIGALQQFRQLNYDISREVGLARANSWL
jgi:hypothetical protein